MGQNRFSGAGQPQISFSERKGPGLGHLAEDGRRHGLNAAKSERHRLAVWRLHELVALAGRASADEPSLGVKIERAFRRSRHDRERGQGAGIAVRGKQRAEVDVAEHIDVVDEKGVAVVEKPGGLLQSTARVEQGGFLRIGDAPQTEVFVFFQKRRDLPAEVVEVDDDLSRAGFDEAAQHVFEQGPAGHFHEGLGPRVGEGLEPGAAPGGEDHGFHGPCEGASACAGQ